jgi:hypothetical protein
MAGAVMLAGTAALRRMPSLAPQPDAPNLRPLITEIAGPYVVQ